jgi:polyhydroxyalkanoate synthase
MPVLNLYTETDHIIPPPASVVLGDKVGSQDYTQDVVAGGHIGVFVSRNGGKLRDRIMDWLEKR